ncbi:uncharacterized protein LOC130012924 [Patella vulgata]|uniref:uncharacterized protein LOC130012924 n=1 Tax=Patella vulgata TaxID=6465 RepID=UPI0024A82ADB|nr:uncharacterized protein LOC130012924 [Patella vulgata]
MLVAIRVNAFRESYVNIRVNTTNGLERQHRELKENYLKNSTLSKTLNGMIEILMEKFFSDSMNRTSKKSFWPCKHLLSVIAHFPQFSWNALPTKFTSNPYFMVDTDFIIENSENDSQEHIHK